MLYKSVTFAVTIGLNLNKMMNSNFINVNY